MLTFTDPQGLRENDDLWRQITCGSRVPRAEVREEVIKNLGEDHDFMTSSEVDAIVDYHIEREQNEG